MKLSLGNVLGSFTFKFTTNHDVQAMTPTIIEANVCLMPEGVTTQ